MARPTDLHPNLPTGSPDPGAFPVHGRGGVKHSSRQKRMVGTAHRKGQLPPGLPLEMTCPPSPSLFGIQFPGGGFFDAGRSATRAPTHPAATRSAANSQFRVFLAFWECTFVRFRWSPREGSDSNAKPSPRRGSGEPQKLIWISGRSHSTRHLRTFPRPAVTGAGPRGLLRCMCRCRSRG